MSENTPLEPIGDAAEWVWLPTRDFVGQLSPAVKAVSRAGQRPGEEEFRVGKDEADKLKEEKRLKEEALTAQSKIEQEGRDTLAGARKKAANIKASSRAKTVGAQGKRRQNLLRNVTPGRRTTLTTGPIGVQGEEAGQARKSLLGL